MNDDAIQDLKQFIAATVSQQVSSVSDDIISSVRDDINKLDSKLTAKIDDLSLSVAEALENTNEASAAILQNHEQRITTLEKKTA